MNSKLVALVVALSLPLLPGAALAKGGKPAHAGGGKADAAGKVHAEGKAERGAKAKPESKAEKAQKGGKAPEHRSQQAVESGNPQWYEDSTRGQGRAQKVRSATGSEHAVEKEPAGESGSEPEDDASEESESPDES